MSMLKTVRLQQEDFDAIDEDIHPGGANSYPSPYDVPQAITVDQDGVSQSFTVSFAYICEEPTKTCRLSEAVVVHGRNSGRIHHIEMETAPCDEADLARQAANVIHHLTKQVRKTRATTNYLVVEMLMARMAGKLMAGRVVHGMAASSVGRGDMCSGQAG